MVVFMSSGHSRSRFHTRRRLWIERLERRDLCAGLVNPSGTFAAQQGVYLFDNPPSLPPSNPATTVNVSNVKQLRAAVNNLQSGQTVSLAMGIYDLTGLADALYVPQGITNWSIRGATGNRNDTVIKGAGMNGSVQFGFWIGNSPNGTIADLTIDGTRDNAILINPGSSGILIHDLRIVDSGSQFIKSNPDTNGNGNDRGTVEYCVFEYRTTDTDNYTNGVDIHAGDKFSLVPRCWPGTVAATPLSKETRLSM
jgi:hypothetical protein